ATFDGGGREPERASESPVSEVEVSRIAAVPLPRIAPDTPVADLLPTPPGVNRAPVYLGEALACVPELTLEAPPGGQRTTEQWQARKARASAAALHLNAREQDGYLKALLRTRPDLAGLPFAMGGACRMEEGRRAAFKTAAQKARRGGGVPSPGWDEE